MHVRRSALAPLVLLLAAPLLGGCGGSDSASADPTPHFSSAPPTSSAPPPTRESPEHFIRRWAEAEKRMENTGKTAEYLAMSKGCKACGLLARTVAEYYGKGGYIHWNGWTIKSVQRFSGRGNHVGLAVRSVSAPTTYRTSSSSPEMSLRGGPIAYQFHLSMEAGTWQVTSKAQLDE